VIDFRIDLIPPTSTSQQKRAVALPGKGIRFFKTKAQQQAENNYMALVYPHRPPEPMQGPVSLSICFTFPWRKSEPKKNRVNGCRPHETRPDVDNIAKALIDVMGASGFWRDDAQIAEMHLKKQWGDKVGIQVRAQPTHTPAQDVFGCGCGSCVQSDVKTPSEANFNMNAKTI